MQQLGRVLFLDTTLSNPKGQSCSTCHTQAVGWSSPFSAINQTYGPVPGAVAGRFGFRKPPSIGYASLMPDGPPTFSDDFRVCRRDFSLTAGRQSLGPDSRPMQNPNEMNNTPAGVVRP